MRTNPAKYNANFEWLKGTMTQSAVGQNIPSYTSNGYLWGSLENQDSSDGTQFGARKTLQTCTIRFRQKIGITVKDCIRDLRVDEEWTVESLYYSFADDETVCDCRKEDK